MEKYTPEFGIIETTLRCNFNCIHCGSKAGEKRQNELTLKEIENILSDLKDLGCNFISYMGGEFFLRIDWQKILEVTQDLGFEYSIVTNGYLVSDKILNKLKQTGIKSLCFSLDSASAVQHDSLRGKQGAFDRVIENLKKTYSYNIPAAVYTTVNKKNIYQLGAILELLLELDINLTWKIILASCHDKKFSEEFQVDENTFLQTAKFISENKIKYNNCSKIFIEESHDIGYCSAKYPNISEQFIKTGCSAGINHFGIQSNGNVKGCLSLQDEFIEGNIREKSFKEIWNNPNNFSYTRKFKNNMLEGICKTCIKAKREECRGGCRDFSYSSTGSLFSPPFCLYNIENNNENTSKK